MVALTSLHVTLDAYKYLLGKQEWSDEEFMQWVRKETGTDSDDTVVPVDPVDPVDPIDPVEPRDPVTADLEDLSEQEMMTLFGTIGGIEYYGERIQMGDELYAHDMATLI